MCRMMEGDPLQEVYGRGEPRSPRLAALLPGWCLQAEAACGASSQSQMACLQVALPTSG